MNTIQFETQGQTQGILTDPKIDCHNILPPDSFHCQGNIYTIYTLEFTFAYASCKGPQGGLSEHC